MVPPPPFFLVHRGKQKQLRRGTETIKQQKSDLVSWLISAGPAHPFRSFTHFTKPYQRCFFPDGQASSWLKHPSTPHPPKSLCFQELQQQVLVSWLEDGGRGWARPLLQHFMRWNNWNQVLVWPNTGKRSELPAWLNWSFAALWF